MTLQGAHPLRVRHVDPTNLDVVSLGVLHQGGGAVEAHRPGVQQPREEGRRVVALEIRRCVGDQRERSRVALGEPIESEGSDVATDGFLGFGAEPLLLNTNK